MLRSDGRQANQRREVTVVTNCSKYAEGSCLIEFGDTHVLCTASVEEKVPPFLENSGRGWVTAEYGMLPRSTNTRIKRDKAANSGRTFEIQRLIGRSLRSVANIQKLGERTIKVDCDVIQADGGTRTAAITGGFIAMVLAMKHLCKKSLLTSIPIKDYVAAISVGIFDGQEMIDLNYVEDSNAQMDMNVVMVGKGEFVEIQGTAEGEPFSYKNLRKLLDLAQSGIEELITIQKSFLKESQNIS